jgi:hypothetical protein
MNQIRTERTHGLTERLDAAERGALVQLRHTPGYEVLLDLMERACIAQETKLINAPVEDTELILAEHKMSKAFWQVFQTMQQLVETEIDIHLGLESERKAADEAEDSYDPDQEILGTGDVRGSYEQG